MDQLQIWREELRRYPVDVAAVAVETCKSESDWWPGFAMFRTACADVVDRRHHERERMVALDAPKPEPNPSRLAEILNALKHPRVQRDMRRAAVGRAQDVVRRYKVDPETGHAEVVEP